MITCCVEAAKGGYKIETSIWGMIAAMTTEAAETVDLNCFSWWSKKAVVSFTISKMRNRNTYSARSSCTLIKLFNWINPQIRSRKVKRKIRIFNRDSAKSNTWIWLYPCGYWHCTDKG